MWPALPPLPRTLAAALRDLEDPSPVVRVSAISDLLGHAADDAPGIPRALVKALTDPDARVRAHAASSLGEIGHVDALASLLAAVEDDDALVRQMAVQSLGLLGDRRALARLQRAIEDPRPEVRFQAVIALPKIAPDEATDVLISAAHDDDPAIRYIALRVAEELVDERMRPDQDTPRIEQIAREKLDDPSVPVRIAAALLLGRRGGREGADVIVAVVEGRLHPDDPQDEAACVDVIGELGLRAAIPGLERRAFGASRIFKECFPLLARISLAKLGHARAKSAILADLRAWSRERRTLAVVAVGRVPLVEARELVLSMRGHADLADPEAVETSLRALENAAAVHAKLAEKSL